MRPKFVQPEYIKKAFRKLQVELKKPDVEHEKKMEARRIRAKEFMERNPHRNLLESMPCPNDKEGNKQYLEDLKKAQNIL